jgi:hypothetical protein
VRSVDADIIPALSDYLPFWRARVPFLFLTSGRSRVYHTPDDTPEKLDYPKIEATSRWLTRFVRSARVRPTPVVFDENGHDDAGSLDEVGELVRSLASVSPEAKLAVGRLTALRAQCDASGRLPGALRAEIAAVVGMLESRLAKSMNRTTFASDG